VSGTGRRVEAKGLVKEYRRRRVVDGVDLSFEQGEIVGLLGPNGAGKTTTFYMIVGLERPDSGQVLLDGQQITRLPMHLRARRGLGYLAQEASVFRKLTVRENILLVLEAVGVPGRERRAKADALLEELSIAARADARAYTLSGGERRRVEIARALAADPSFVLLDEPFANIDPKTVEEIQHVIHQLKARGIGILITDHSVRETLRTVDRAYILVDGKVVTQGTALEIAADPIARKFYLGDAFSL
jgi:lipopolysaccharide export system ATP-binding protein